MKHFRSKGSSGTGVFLECGVVVCRVVSYSKYTRENRNGRLDGRSDEAWRFCDSVHPEERRLLKMSQDSGIPVILRYLREMGKDDEYLGDYVVTKEAMIPNEGCSLKSYVLRAAPREVPSPPRKVQRRIGDFKGFSSAAPACPAPAPPIK